MQGIVKLATWNVKGIGHVIKRKKILTSLKKERIAIALLQETHLSDTEHGKLKRDWVGQVYYSSFTSSSRGVAILIHKDIPFSLEHAEFDSEGRFVLISGHLFGVHLTIGNVYAPNTNCSSFISRTVLQFNKLCRNLGFLGGDFNCVMDNNWDKSNPQTLTGHKPSLTLQNFCKDLGLVDIWRELHPKIRNYTFYSHPHKSYSRLDYLFTPSDCIYRVKSCHIGPIVLSDHSPVYLDFDINVSIPKSNFWKFNVSHLNNNAFCTFLKQKIAHYWQDNQNSPVSSATKWDAAKAVLRGHIISYSSLVKKVKTQKRRALEAEVTLLENLHKQMPNQMNWTQLNRARAKLNLDHTEHIKKLLFFSKQKYYEFGNKPSHLLAYQLKKAQQDRIIKAVRTPEGNVTFDSQTINDTFANFYRNLYKAESVNLQEHLSNYLNTIFLPTVSETDRTSLNAPFTKEEIWLAIESMPSNKAPGPDGFPLEFYKQLWEDINPILLPAINNLLDSNSMPDSWSSAVISLILKKDKDPLDCSSYRPISLLNVDYKIMAKAMARRLESILPSVISPDQTEFVKSRYGSDNIRRLLNILDYIHVNKDPTLIISLDAEKAFDRVDWPFLFAVLERIDLGSNFIKLIKLLYSQPMATVNTNRLISNTFPVSRGCRQGCPLSPLLFSLVIEPLAAAVRASTNLRGIKIGSEEHRISLYADDVLLYFKYPETSVDAILSIIDEYSTLSGYKINLNKSQALYLYSPPEATSDCPFRLAPSGFQYLGINITPILGDLFKANYTKLISKMSQDLSNWSNLPISFFGKINVIRMNVLPRLNFLFQSLPCYLNSVFFKNLNSIFSKFIWNNKKPRLKFSVLLKPKELGGASLPNFQLYFWSAQIKNMINWFLNRTDSQWLGIESTRCFPNLLNTLPFIYNVHKLESVLSIFTVSNTLLAWKDVLKYLSIPLTLSLKSPISLNPDLPPAIQSIGFRSWRLRGILDLDQLFDNGVLKSFQLLKQEFNLPSNDFYKFLQLRHFLEFILKNEGIRFDLSDIEKQLFSSPALKKKISVFYSMLSNVGTSSFDSLKVIWEKDFETNFSDEEWLSICSGVFFRNASISNHEQSFKFIYRTYLTPVRLHKIFPNVSQYCFKCKSNIGTVMHVFWDCDMIKTYWKEIHKMVQKIIGKSFELSPSIYLLNSKFELHLNHSLELVLHLCSFLARKCILLLWSTPHIPSTTMWLNQITTFLPLEKLTCDLRQRSDDFWRIWSPLWDFLENVR